MIPAGSRPAAGAAAARPASPVVLGDGDPEAIAGFQATHDAAVRAAKKFNGRVDLDDLQQQVNLEMLIARRNKIAKGMPAAQADKLVARYLSVISRANAQQQFAGTHNPLDAQAMIIFKQECDAEESRTGRSLTAADRAAIGERVRALWDGQTYKPTIGFWLRDNHLPIENAEHAIEAAANSDYLDPETARLHHLVDKGSLLLHAGGQRAAKALAWDLVAARHGAPAARAGLHTEKAAAKHRAVINAAGGAHTAAVAVENDTATTQQREALFAPFGPVGTRDKAAICDALARNPSRAALMWSEALKASTKKPPRPGTEATGD